MMTKTKNVDSRFGDIVSVIVSTTALAFFVVVARLWIRIRMTKAQLWWDDFCAVMALLESFGLGAVNMGRKFYHLMELIGEGILTVNWI